MKTPEGYRMTYLVVVIHAGEVCPAFVAPDFNETLGKKQETLFTDILSVDPVISKSS